VVNQTTLLMNETLEIIELLRDTFRRLHGDDARVGGGGRRDTLCYATQVNQDALARALAGPLDAAFVIGGRNSSNTYQLYRLCAEKLGARAFFIQSEANLPSLATIDHYIYDRGGQGRLEGRPLWPEGPPTKPRILVTGGASCPDGIIQQVIHRLNGFFPAGSLRGIEAVLADLQLDAQEAPGVPR
jgi:4-hydroxy-3-methylbut-2-enyl diphosphate reductase